MNTLLRTGLKCLGCLLGSLVFLLLGVTSASGQGVNDAVENRRLKGLGDVQVYLKATEKLEEAKRFLGNQDLEKASGEIVTARRYFIKLNEFYPDWKPKFVKAKITECEIFSDKVFASAKSKEFDLGYDVKALSEVELLAKGTLEANNALESQKRWDGYELARSANATKAIQSAILERFPDNGDLKTKYMAEVLTRVEHGGGERK